MLRGKQTSLGMVTPALADTSPQTTIDDPFAPDFNPCGDSSRDITTYLLALQKQVYKDTCLSYMPYQAVHKNIIRLLKLYTPAQIKRAVRLSVVSKYPPSTKFIKQLIEQHFNENTNL